MQGCVNATLDATRVLFGIAIATGFVVGIVEVKGHLQLCRSCFMIFLALADFRYHHLAESRLLHHKFSQEGNNLKISSLKNCCVENSFIVFCL